MDSETTVFNVDDIDSVLIEQALKEISDALEEKDYNAINQLVGYLISGDLGYISTYKDSRKKISKLERTKILEVILRKYLNK